MFYVGISGNLAQKMCHLNWALKGRNKILWRNSTKCVKLNIWFLPFLIPPKHLVKLMKQWEKYILSPLSPYPILKRTGKGTAAEREYTPHRRHQLSCGTELGEILRQEGENMLGDYNAIVYTTSRIKHQMYWNKSLNIIKKLSFHATKILSHMKCEILDESYWNQNQTWVVSIKII